MQGGFVSWCMLTFIRQPVYGLIFLFQYFPGMEEPTEEHDASDVWFANQVSYYYTKIHIKLIQYRLPITHAPLLLCST
jgi:hypothetical protein